MTDNLNKIIEHHEDKKLETNEEELNIEVKEEENNTPIIIEKKEKEMDLKITDLSTWFNKQSNGFSGINKLDVKISGIDPDESIIVTIPDFSNPEKKKLKVIDNANLRPVLNYKALEMNIFNSGFSITYLFLNEKKVMRCYGVKTGLVIVHCQIIEDIHIPYFKEKIIKKQKGINFIENDIEYNKLNKEIDMESMLIQYPQFQKEDVKFKTNLDVIIWFNERRKKILDINHLLKIDSIIINMINT